jgi:hypothetical protein
MTIVDESMKLIKMMRDNGWISVSDDVIWDAVGKDISFAKAMRNHSVDVTRRMGASSSPPLAASAAPEAPPAPKKAARPKKTKQEVAAKGEAPSPRAQAGRQAGEREAYATKIVGPEETWMANPLSPTTGGWALAMQNQRNRWDIAKREGLNPEDLHGSNFMGDPLMRWSKKGSRDYFAHAM